MLSKKIIVTCKKKFLCYYKKTIQKLIKKILTQINKIKNQKAITRNYRVRQCLMDKPLESKNLF